MSKTTFYGGPFFPASKARSRQKLVSEVQKMDGLPLAGTNVMILKIFSPKN
jgi:hypothetical protein